MKWEENTDKRFYYLDLAVAQDKIWEAYIEIYINWNTFQEALKRIKAVKNSIEIGGLYDQEYIKKGNLRKPIEDWD